MLGRRTSTAAERERDDGWPRQGLWKEPKVTLKLLWWTHFNSQLQCFVSFCFLVPNESTTEWTTTRSAGAQKRNKEGTAKLGLGCQLPATVSPLTECISMPLKKLTSTISVEGTIATATSSIVTILRVNLFYFLIISIFVCLYLGMHISAVSHGSQKRLQIPEVGVIGSSELPDCGSWKPNSGPL